MLIKNHLKDAIKNARHALPSIISSLDDDKSTQECHGLVKLLAESAIIASAINIKTSSDKDDSVFFNTYPGEHYKLLAGIITTLQPKCLVDIGTFTGMSARIMLDYSNKESEVHTFDILSFDNFNTHLTPADFEQRHFFQHLDDLSDQGSFQKHLELLDRADIIFCDAPKDGKFEYKFLELLSQSIFSDKKRLLILDDIKFLNMWRLWRSIGAAKIDATSFGHWSGTGIVDISNGLSFAPKLQD